MAFSNQILNSMHLRVRDLMNRYYPDEEDNPAANKLLTALALFGVYCTTRKLYSASRPLADQLMARCLMTSNASLRERYGSGWALVLNSVDQMGNTYACQLASNGFDLILVGPAIEEERMHS